GPPRVAPPLMLEPGPGGEAGEGARLRGHRVLGGEASHAGGRPGAALVEGERGGGEMVRRPRERLPYGALPARPVIAGEAVDEIEAHVGKARGASPVEGPTRVRGGVEPVQRGQHAVVEALHAQADAGDAGRAIAGGARGGEALGIALHGDLGVRL